MYTPAKYLRQDVKEMVDCAREFPFALAVSGSKYATWIPVVVSMDEKEQKPRFDFHLARANPHAQALASGNEEDVMLVFLGPHGYISPRWYGDRVRNVPTWNFVAFHVKGKPKPISDNKQLLAMLNNLVVNNEAKLSGPEWSLKEAQPRYVELMSENIIGFTMTCDSFQGKAKLSQDFSDEDRVSMIRELVKSGNERLSKEMQRSLDDDIKTSKL